MMSKDNIRFSINSREYWDDRFEGDWQDMQGKEQTAFFAKVALRLMPSWLKTEIISEKLSICDFGCALGQAVDILHNSLQTEVYGIDFSQQAVENAQNRFSQYKFIQKDIVSGDMSDLCFDIGYISNVLEHIPNPWQAAENIARCISQYLIIMIPFREILDIDEHCNKFDTANIPTAIGKMGLIYVDYKNCADIETTLYPDNQILLLYSKCTDLSRHFYLDNFVETFESKYRLQLVEEQKKTDELVSESEQKIKQYETTISENQSSISELENALNECKVNIESLTEDIRKLNETIAANAAEKEQLEQHIFHLQNELSKTQSILTTTEKDKSTLHNELYTTERLLAVSERKVIALESNIRNAIQECNSLTNWGLYKFSHFLHRTRHQFLLGSHAEKKRYMEWLHNYIKGNGTDFETKYKPVCRISAILKGNDFYLSESVKNSPLGQHLIKENAALESPQVNESEVRAIQEILSTHEYKGILVYPHVVYWEPLQTPQQLLKAFARLGWLCFFCEHPNLPDIFREVEENVIIVHEKEFLHAISDTEVIVLFTWLGSLAFVNKLKQKKIWYHILDKLDIFPFYDVAYQTLHEEITSTAEHVSYVSSPLAECIQNRKEAVFLPNGVNPGEFVNIHDCFIPEDMEDIVKSGHKIIGYYGYIAEWMDYELVRNLALFRPEYEFILIGKAIHDTSAFHGLDNIHLLGLKPYKELSDYAKFFDVAVIPFIIDEKMDCVSPIKFYEYCALGLPVVTSKMTDMLPYANEYIACASGLDEFLFYLDKLTDGKYKKLAKEHGPKIAQSNTWTARAQSMEAVFDVKLNHVLSQPYKKFDVIILGVIDYDFRFQRPQQLAVRYAQNGHRVFYFNANHYNEYSVSQIEKNLHVINIHNKDFTAIHLTDWLQQLELAETQFKKVLDSYCIRDAVMIVDYPNWIHIAQKMREKYGFKIITDYMDDYTGFLNPAEELVRNNCEKLLKISDQVIASSQFLADIACKFNKHVDIIRNGTEFTHFNKAYRASGSDKIIGYYGAVAEWFDVDKVIFLAKNLPECEIQIIGHITSDENRLKKYPNIRLMGEKPYSDLTEYLEAFDVCLIPFDTSTDLIKATNPVKFYEYLSAGKKVVATEIPELAPFKDKYVYMSNENDTFLEYVKLCLDGKDTLQPDVEKMRLAQSNDWQERYEKFMFLSKECVPKVSIVILTYNNLELNKLCLQSILNTTAYPNYEIIIVDNHSTDGTREYLEKFRNENPSVKVIFNRENLGFAAGNNVGMKAASGDYIVLLNNDTVITRGWLTAMCKHLENDPALGMCGPVTNSIGNEAKIAVTYHSINELHQFAYDYTTRHLCEEYRSVNVLALFCTMIKKQVIDACGYLDENYGIGMFEDDDYSEMAKSKGFSLTIAEDAFVHHFEGVSFKKLEDETFNTIFQENKTFFEKKWKTKWISHKKRPGVDQMTNAGSTII